MHRRLKNKAVATLQNEGSGKEKRKITAVLIKNLSSRVYDLVISFSNVVIFSASIKFWKIYTFIDTIIKVLNSFFKCISFYKIAISFFSGKTLSNFNDIINYYIIIDETYRFF